MRQSSNLYNILTIEIYFSVLFSAVWDHRYVISLLHIWSLSSSLLFISRPEFNGWQPPFRLGKRFRYHWHKQSNLKGACSMPKLAYCGRSHRVATYDIQCQDLWRLWSFLQSAVLSLSLSGPPAESWVCVAATLISSLCSCLQPPSPPSLELGANDPCCFLRVCTEDKKIYSNPLVSLKWRPNHYFPHWNGKHLPYCSFFQGGNFLQRSRDVDTEFNNLIHIWTAIKVTNWLLG